MTQYYIGVKQVLAWRQDKDGQEGYAVKYEDGYVSWSPKAAFEKAYLLQGNDPTLVPESMLRSLIAEHEVSDFGDHTTLVSTVCRTGFTVLGHSSCVDPKNYSQEIGAKLASQENCNKLWGYLGFVLQWAKDGLGHGGS